MVLTLYLLLFSIYVFNVLIIDVKLRHQLLTNVFSNIIYITERSVSVL